MTRRSWRPPGRTAADLFRSAWTENRTSLKTRLSSGECLTRLKADLGSSIFMNGSGPVIGRVGDASATLARRIYYGNSFRTYVRARVRENPSGGAGVDCIAAMHPGPRAFMTAWFGFILLWWIGAIAATLARPAPAAWVFWVAPIPMLTFGFILVAGCRFLARNDEALILSYLRQRLEADAA